jgi:hypothetical protein
MENLKSFYANIRDYSKAGIKIFINDISDGFKPSLVIDLNSEFVDLYLEEINLINKSKRKVDFDDVMENIYDLDIPNSAYPKGTGNTIERRYKMIDGMLEIGEKKVQLENLSYRDYNRINYKIFNFQTCIQEIVDEINSTATNQNNTFSEPLDLSDTLGNEKIVYVHKLGLIDFLIKKQPFNTSVNSLAIALSAVTGEKTTTIQSYLNPILKKETAQKNNPLNNKKLVERVEKQLIRIGFNLDETN